MARKMGPARRVVNHDHLMPDGSIRQLLVCGHTFPWAKGTWSFRHCAECDPDGPQREIAIKLTKAEAADLLKSYQTSDSAERAKAIHRKLRAVLSG